MLKSVITILYFCYNASTDNCTACVDVHGNPNEDALFIELFVKRHYNHVTHPVFNLTETTHVQLGLVLQKIIQVVCNYSVTNRKSYMRFRLTPRSIP